MSVWDSLLQGLGTLLAGFYQVIPSYGVAIILLTITVRLALLPLTIKQTRSMHAMQKLAPEIKKLQAKHKGDKQKLNEEMMKLYQEQGVNPLGGCLPMILQLPVFYALFRLFSKCSEFITVRGKQVCDPATIGIFYLPADSALKAAISSGNAGFLGMNLGLSPTQAWQRASEGGVLGGVLGVAPYALWVVLMGATTWFQQRQMTARQESAQPPQAQMMMKIMPIFLAFISLNFPVALTVYWVASNVWTVGQQHLMLRPKPAPAPAAAAPQEPLGNPEPGAGNGRADGAGGPSKHKGSGARKRRRGKGNR